MTQTTVRRLHAAGHKAKSKRSESSFMTQATLRGLHAGGHKAKGIAPSVTRRREAWQEEALDDLP